MVRELKFRAWYSEDGKQGEMVEFGIFGTDEGYDVDTQTQLQGCPVMQFTGLKDKNGVEVYEGDIIGDKYPKLISFSDYHGAFVGTPVGDLGITWMDPRQTLTQKWFDDLDIIVVGNIYKNPELLTARDSKD